MASGLSADAPAFNPGSACGSSGRGDCSADDPSSEAAAASIAGASIAAAQTKPSSQSQPLDSVGGANLDGSKILGKADAGESDQLQPASQPKSLASTGCSGLYGQGVPAYMVNCYPFVRQPPPSAAGSDLIASATVVSPRSVDDGGSLDYLYHSNAKGATSPEWLLTHSSVSMGGYPYVAAAAAPAAFVTAHTAVSPPVMQIYGGGTGSWPAMQAPAGGGGSNGYHVYPPIAVAAHTELPFRTAGERGRLSRPGAHRGGRAGGWRRGTRWSNTEIGGGSGAWDSTADESHSVTAVAPSARSYQRGGRWRRGDETAPDDDSTGRNGWIQERATRAHVTWGTASVGTQNESNSPAAGRWSRPRTQIVKDAGSQTDLADSIAHLTLEEMPSSFYVGHVAGTTAPVAVRGRGRQPGASSNPLIHGVDSITAVEAGSGTLPATYSHRGGRTVRSSAAAHVVDSDQSPRRSTDGAASNPRIRPDPTDASGNIESTADRAVVSRRAGCDRAASLQDGGSGSRQSPTLAVVHRSGATELRTAARGSCGQAPSGECGSPDVSSDGIANVGGAVVTEATRKRRCRRGPRKSKAAAAAAASAAAVASDQHDDVVDDEANEEKEQWANPRSIAQATNQRRLLADVVKSQPLAARHAAAPGISLGNDGASASEGSRPATSASPASSCAVMSRGPLTVEHGGDSSSAALVNGAHSYSQALLKTVQPSAAARRPTLVPQSAWAVNETNLSDRDASDVEKAVEGGFMFNSVSYASRVSVSGTVSQRRPNSGGTRGGVVGASSGGDRSHSVTSAAAVAVAGESIDRHSDSTASGSRRQKKAESARLAAAEEQMEISLEQQVLLGQIGRLAAGAPTPATDASKKQLHAVSSSSAAAAPFSSSGKKSKQALSLNLSDMIAAAAATAANKKKEAAASRDEVQSRKLGDVTKRGGAKSFAAATAPNALDSTAPTIKRGKEREKPKVKRPSALKKVILKERQDRKESRATGTAAAAAAIAVGVSSDGQLSGGGGSGDFLSSSCGGSDDIRLLGQGASGTVPTSSSGCSGQHGIDDNLIVNLEVAERQQPLDGSFEGTMALSTPGGTSGRLSSRSGDAFTPASQASMPLSPISQSSPISVEALSLESSPFASEAGTPVRPIDVAKEMQLQQEIAHRIHSRRFREYCDQLLDRDIDDACTLLLHELVRFQERLFARDPVKAKTRRRLVLGLREVTKHLRLRKIKLVIVSPNVERIQSKGGLDDALSTVVSLCREQAVPLVFALGRRALGRACGKLVPVSVAGVFMYDGAEIHYRHLMELTQKARDGYEDMIKLVAQEAADERQKLAAAASGRSSPPVPKQPSAGGSASTQTVPQLWPQASMQPSLSTATQPIDVVRIAAAASMEGVSSSSTTVHPQAAAAPGHNRQLVTSTNDNDDCADEEATRRRNFEYDGDAGNEADVEDSLQDSVAVPGYYRLLNGDGTSEAEAVPVLPVAIRPPLSRKASSRDPAVAKPPPADAESDGSTALVASATVTCSSSSHCSGSSCNVCSGSDASTTAPGRSGNKKRGKSRQMKGSRAGDGASAARGSETSAAACAAVQPLPLDIRERVESWVAAHTNAAAVSSTVGEVAVPTAADLLDVDDVAEFTATLSACTANSDALLLVGAAVGSGSGP